MSRRRPSTKAGRNEGRKLLATALNAAGLAVFGLGTVAPVVSDATWGLSEGLCLAIFAVLHGCGQIAVRRLED